MDIALISTEVVDSVQKNGMKGLVYKLDMEKDYNYGS